MIFSSKDLRRLVIPLVVEQTLAVTIGMVDSVMVASCGEASVSGISLVDQINILLIGLFSAMASGGAVVAAQYMGRKDGAMVGKAARQLFLSVGGLSTLFMAVALLLNRQILILIYRNLEPDVMAAATTYFYIMALSYPFLGIYNGGAALFRAIGNSKISMKVSFIANLMNVVGNAILIYGFDMGVAGAGLATLASRVTCCVVIVTLLWRSKEISIRGSWRYDHDMMKRILYVGIPSGLENSIFQVGKLIVSSMIASLGTVAITANAVNSSIGNFQNVPSNAVGVAMITVVGQCIGANDKDQAVYYVKKMMKTAYAFMIALSLTIAFLARPLCGLYHLSAETSELTVIILVYNCLCSMLLHPLSFALPNGLRAAGDVKYTMVVAIASMWICRIILAYVLAIYFGLGLLGVWIAMTCDWLARGICFVTRFRTDRWAMHTDQITGGK